MGQRRTELQKAVVEALVNSKAVDFEKVGNVLAKFGERAAITGDSIGALIHWRVIDVCIPPDPWQRGFELEQAAGPGAQG